MIAAAPTLLPQEAQTLPLAELAHRVLGATGAIVVDAERPHWPVCTGMYPPAQPHPDGPPPLTSLTFYTRASASNEAGWFGLCRATAVDVRALADDVTVAKVTGIERIDPRTGLLVTGSAADSGCYRVSLAQPFGSSDQINLCVRVTNTLLTVTQAAFSRNRVV